MTASHATELRQDPVTGNWVIIAPNRDQRPHDAPTATEQPSGTGDCPFCPGNEAETPPEVWRIDGPDGGWWVRVVPNRYPVLAGDGPGGLHTRSEWFRSMPGRGSHEVIVESPEHDADLASVEPDQARAVLEAYRTRYRALQQRGAALVAIFRNHGPRAGTSLAHPHSQIVGMPVVPVDVRHRLETAARYYDDTGKCLYQDLLERELADGRRIVLEGERFVAFQPFASAFPYETWIVPRSPRASFGAALDDELDAFATSLQPVLLGLRRGLHDPDYNFVIHSPPATHADRDDVTWYLQLIPRLTTPAGLELGTGLRVNPTPPEDAAAVLRRAIGESTPN